MPWPRRVVGEHAEVETAARYRADRDSPPELMQSSLGNSYIRRALIGGWPSLPNVSVVAVTE